MAVKYLLAFGSTHRVLKAESVLRAEGVPFRLDPAPSALTAYCDLVITVEGGRLDAALAALGRAGSEPKTVYRKEEDRYVEV